MKKLVLALLVAVCAIATTVNAAEGKKKELSTEQKAFAEKHKLLKDGEIDKKAVKGLSADDKAAFEKLFPVKKKNK